MSSPDIKIPCIRRPSKRAIAAAAIIVAIMVSEPESKRSCWVKPRDKKRNHQSCHENLMRELAVTDCDNYRRWIHMDTETFTSLMTLITPLIKKMDTNMRECIGVAERLALALRYLATGESFKSLSYQFGVGYSTTACIVPEVCRAIYTRLKRKYMTMPSTETEWESIEMKYNELWQFPRCVGALKGKHIEIISPPKSGSLYHNRKGFYSVVMFALVDADLQFMCVDVGSDGRVSDEGPWNDSKMKTMLEGNTIGMPPPKILLEERLAVPFVVVGDMTFGLQRYLMKPYVGKELNNSKKIFNHRLSRARQCAENAFGILTSRWQVFQSPIKLKPSKVTDIILATCALHNFLRHGSSRDIYIPSRSVDYVDKDNGQLHPGTWRSEEINKQLYDLSANVREYPTKFAKEVRNIFEDYFNSIGSVPWQSK